jgi:hypothetical protein
MKRFVIILCLWVIGCGSVSSVRPIGMEEKSVTLSSGGPVTEVFGITMPLPYSVLRYRQGLSDNTDLHIGIHPTMAILGNLGIDVGLTKQLMGQSGWRPAFVLGGSVYGFYHFNETSSIRAYPEISMVASYNLGSRREVIYFGAQNMIQFSEPYLISVLLVGSEIPFGNHFILDLETKWYAPVEESEKRVVDYSITPAGHGVIGFVFGLSYKF